MSLTVSFLSELLIYTVLTSENSHFVSSLFMFHTNSVCFVPSLSQFHENSLVKFFGVLMWVICNSY